MSSQAQETKSPQSESDSTEISLTILLGVTCHHKTRGLKYSEALNCK